MEQVGPSYDGLNILAATLITREIPIFAVPKVAKDLLGLSEEDVRAFCRRGMPHEKCGNVVKVNMLAAPAWIANQKY